MEYRVLSMDDTRRAGEMTKGGARVQIGAELLCKSAKVTLRGRGWDRGWGRKILSGVSG
jgi:hypothetical protein